MNERFSKIFIFSGAILLASGLFLFGFGGRISSVHAQSSLSVEVAYPPEGGKLAAGSDVTLIAYVNGQFQDGDIVSFSYANQVMTVDGISNGPWKKICDNISAPPYTCVWPSVPAGSYFVKASIYNFSAGKIIDGNSIKVYALGSVSLVPHVTSLSASPMIVDYGKSAKISWNSVGSDSCYIYNLHGGGETTEVQAISPPLGSDTGGLYKDTYILIACVNKDNVLSNSEEITIKVNPPEPVVTKFTASSPSAKAGSKITIKPGEAVTLSWNSTNANYCRGAGDPAWAYTQAASGTEVFSNVTEPTSYAISCDNQTVDLKTQESPWSYINVTVASSPGGSSGNGNNSGNNGSAGNTGGKGDTGLVTCTNNCGWNELIAEINKVVNFILIDLAVPLAAIGFAFAGFLLMFSGGEASKRTQAKKIIVNVAIGLVVVAGAWIIVHTVFSILGYDASWIGF